MKILTIIGSHRKGNGLKIVEQVEDIMRHQGDAEFEHLWVKDANLGYCRGCLNCFTRGEAYCPIRDDRQAIEQKMQAADGVIFLSPNYAGNVSAMMKNFIDRFAYVGHRPRLFKPALLISNSAGPGAEECIAKLEGPLAQYGFDVVGRLPVMTPPFPLPAKFAASRDLKVASAATAFYQAVKNPGPQRPTLKRMIGFRALQTMAIKFPDMYRWMYTADYDYWKAMGWLDAKVYYYTDARIGPAKKAAAWLAGKLAAIYLERNFFNENSTWRELMARDQAKARTEGV